MHVVYDLSSRQWVSANANYFFGGETSNDGAPAQIRQENSRFGLTWNVARNPTNVLQFAANFGVITRVGDDSTKLSIVWLHRWK